MITKNPDKPLLGEIPKPPLFWNKNTHANLLHGWIEDTKAAQADSNLGLFEDFGGPTAYKYQKLTDLFAAKYPNFDGNIRNQISELRAKNQLIVRR